MLRAIFLTIVNNYYSPFYPISVLKASYCISRRALSFPLLPQSKGRKGFDPPDPLSGIPASG